MDGRAPARPLGGAAGILHSEQVRWGPRLPHHWGATHLASAVTAVAAVRARDRKPVIIVNSQFRRNYEFAPDGAKFAFCYTIIMKSITTSCFTFEDVIKGNYVYVDKTDLLHKLISDYKGQFFISRPRRFGKSLMLSTLKCIFEGRRELFEGLKITKTDYDWKVYPVLHMDMANATAGSLEAMSRNLVNMAKHLAARLNLEIVDDSDPGAIFENLWKAIADKNLQVVILVDEYDMPLQGYLNDLEKLERVRKMMHDFYVRLKSYSGNIRFMMMTGVSKFAKLSIFSGLNNLTDLTMSADYAGLLGYTHDELKEFFAEHIQAFAEKEAVTRDVIFDKLLEWYDNYSFSPDSDIKVLNPVSVGFALSERKFDNYWISTGKATIVIERLKQAGQLPCDLDRVLAFKDDLDTCDAITMPIESLLYQGGYLTIKDVQRTGALMLGIPNKEVRTAVTNDYLTSEIPTRAKYLRNAQLLAAQYLQEGNLDAAIDAFRTAITELPYEWVDKGKEGAVKTAFALFFYAMNDTHVSYESQSLNGRSDAVVETKDNIYIFEFKYGKSAQEAFDQILEKGYHLPYMNRPIGAAGSRTSQSQLSTLNSQLSGFKPVYGIGLNFNPANGARGIDDAVIGEISRQ